MQQKINADTGLNAKLHVIHGVLRNDMGMRFRKIVKAPLHLNTNKNLILRQEWAKRFITLWSEGKTFLNVDESWLSIADYRRMKW